MSTDRIEKRKQGGPRTKSGERKRAEEDMGAARLGDFVQIAPPRVRHPEKATNKLTQGAKNVTHGVMVFTLMPVLASSFATAFVIPITASLLAQYTLQFGFPTNLVIDAALTMEPPPTSLAQLRRHACKCALDIDSEHCVVICMVKVSDRR